MTAQLDTNFNRSPYFNDYDESKNFHSVAFKPSIAVQVREMNQLQTLLQEQITRFGDNVLKEGTIVKGCAFSYIKKYAYVKVLDLQTDGQPVNISMYRGMRLQGMTTGVTAVVEDTIDGLQSQLPDLNTIYLKYISSGTNNEKVFSSTENIRAINPNTNLEVGVLTVAGLVDPESVGFGYGVKVSDGIVYQKGYFIRVAPQSIVVSKYTHLPNAMRVGFIINESIVDVYADSSLYDNAIGSENENAPGADRLVLTPQLIALTTAEAALADNFFALIEYEDGAPVRTRFRTEYNVIGDEMATRTYDESGNYVVKRFGISVQAHRENPNDFMSVVVSPGKAYIYGYNVETGAPLRVNLEQAKAFDEVQSQQIATNYGQYLLVNQYMGDMSFVGGTVVQLRSAVANAVSGSGIPTTAPGAAVGTAVVRSVEYDSGTAGTGAARYRVFLYDVKLNSGRKFSEVKSLWRTGALAAADVVLVGGNAVWSSYENRTPIFQIGKGGIKSLTSSDYAYRVRMTGTLATSGTMTLTISGDSFAYGVGALTNDQKRDIVMIADATSGSYTKGVPIDLSSATINGTGVGDTLTISGLAAPSASVPVIIYATARKLGARPAQKILREVYIRINPSALSGGVATTEYNLGMPDVQSIVGAWMGTTYAETNTNILPQLKLVGGQQDTHYGFSSVTKAAALTVTSTSRILLKVRVFQKDVTIGNGFFTVDSYVGVTPKQIPNYKGFDLRNSIDFRPWATPTAAYATAIAGSTENPSATILFNDAAMLPPKTGMFFETDYEYYLSRKDRLVVTWEGAFRMIQGVPSEAPSLPAEPNRAMTLATFDVPPYEALTNSQAVSFRKLDHAIKFAVTNNRVWQMAHISAIDRRISQLEYYTVLSALEKSTSDMIIQDADGLDRFKSGILVDPFTDLSIANVQDPEFKAGIDPVRSELTPSFHTVNLPLKPIANVNTTKKGDMITRPYTSQLFISQPAATRFRNCVQNFWVFNGTSYVTPEYDDGVDYSRAPDVNFVVDLQTPLDSLVEAIAEFIPLRNESSTSTRSTSTVTGTNSGVGGRISGSSTSTTTTTTTNTTTIVNELKNSGNSTSSESVGDFVSNIEFSPFMRSNELKVVITGLRPNTRHYVFFDEVPMNAHCQVASLQVPAEGAVNGLRPSSVKGANLVSNNAGTLSYIFTIPDGQFFVGDRVLLTTDVDNIASMDTATSFSRFTYRAFNFSVQKTGLTMSTVIPQYETVQEIETTTTTDSVTVTRPVITGGGGSGNNSRGDSSGRSGNGRGDPLAQTFFVDPDSVTGSEMAMLTEIDVYFKSKSDTYNLNAMIRVVSNGQPTPTIVPGGLKIVTPSEIKVSDDGSVATRIVFDTPVVLTAGQEYAVILKPDGNCPDYNVFTAAAGQKDLITMKPINNDWGQGMLMSSTNDRTWTSYQNEDMKLNIYIARFATGSGTATFAPKDVEFFSLNATSGRFQTGERVYREAANLAGNVSFAAVGSKEAVGTGTAFLSTYAPGDWMVIPMPTGVHIAQVESVVSNVRLFTVEPAPFLITNRPHYKTLLGKVIHARYEEPIQIALSDSTAKSGFVFAAGNKIVGQTSGAAATIASVDNLVVSYVQPHIYRVVDTVNNVRMTATLMTAAGTGYSKNGEFGSNIYADRHNTVVRSRSTEIASFAGTYGSTFLMQLTNSSIFSSPILNASISATDVVTYQINDSSTNEHTNLGEAKARYIGRTIELSNEVGAKDLKLYLTTYKPSGTDIEVYAKFKNAADPADFEDKAWTKLYLDPSKNALSSAVDKEDYREIPFIMPLSVQQSGTAWADGMSFEYTDSNGTVYDNFKFFAIKIVLKTANSSLIPKVKDMRAIALAG